MTLSLYFAGAIVIAVLAWVLGSIALRVAGWLGMVVGIVTLPGAFAMGNLVLLPMSVVLFGLGVLLWLAGHWLFAFKNHGFRSGVALRILDRIFGGRFNPTRDWAVPVYDVSRDR